MKNFKIFSQCIEFLGILLYYIPCKSSFAVSRDILTLKNTTKGTLLSDKNLMLKKQNTVFLTESALIAALYAVLTYVSAAMNLAFGVVQFRFAEALTVLPIFTPAAIPGLTVGCIISNLASPLGVADWIFGPVATLLASLLTRKLKDIKLLGIPFLSILMPVIFNAVIIGFEISLIGDGGAFSLSFVNMSLFVSNALSVALGEGLVLIVLGIPLIILLNKSKLLKRIKKS